MKTQLLSILLVLLVSTTVVISIRTSNDDQHKRPDTFRQVLDRMINTTIPPNNLPYLVNNTLPTKVWTRNVVGRLTDVLNLRAVPAYDVTGIEFTAQYYLATTRFFSIPGFHPVGFFVSSFFQQGLCAQYTYSVNFTSITGSTDILYPLTVTGTYRFKYETVDGCKQPLVDRYDIVVLREEAWSTAIGLNNSDPAVQAGDIAYICGQVTTYCVGPNLQYASYSACVAYLTNNVTFGTACALFSNTVDCRFVHAQMVAQNAQAADVHCPHTGPTGGDACINRPYLDWYADSLVLFGDDFLKCGHKDGEDEDNEDDMLTTT